MSYRTVVSNSRKNMNTAVWKCAVQQSIQRRKRSRSTPNVSPWANHQNRLDTNNSYLSNGPDGNDEFTFNRTKSKCIWEWKSIRIYQNMISSFHQNCHFGEYPVVRRTLAHHIELAIPIISHFIPT